MIIPVLLLSFFAATAAALLSASITWAVWPLFLRYVLAKPNPRSSHRAPTPQGAGISVIGATLVVAEITMGWLGTAGPKIPSMLFAMSLFIAAVGMADDIRSMPVLPRLFLQALAICAVVFTASEDLRIVPACPLWVERSLILLAGLWFVNLVNFMDGLDWMMVAEVVPITGALVLLGTFGELSPSATVVAASLCGAMIGFAPFNRPVAKIFLGDVGSLPIGLLLGWLLLELVYRHHFVAAILLPLYYLADASVTLMRRSVKREPVWLAHRSHFYQRATDHGFGPLRIVSEVFVLNLGLAALATASTITQSTTIETSFLILGGLAVTLILLRFSRQR